MDGAVSADIASIPLSPAGSYTDTITPDSITLSVTATMDLVIGDNTGTTSACTVENTNDLHCPYTVTTDDAETVGVSLNANAITLAAGASLTNTDTGLALGLDHAARQFVGQLVNAADAQPTVLSITFDDPPGAKKTFDKSYDGSETIPVSVQFSAEVEIVAPNANDRAGVALQIGDVERVAQGCAAAGDDATTVNCSYVVGGDDVDDDGISIPADPLRFDYGGVIRGSGGGATVDPTFGGVAADAARTVNTSVPKIYYIMSSHWIDHRPFLPGDILTFHVLTSYFNSGVDADRSYTPTGPEHSIKVNPRPKITRIFPRTYPGQPPTRKNTGDVVAFIVDFDHPVRLVYSSTHLKLKIGNATQECPVLFSSQL